MPFDSIEEPLPHDPLLRTGELANGLRYYVRPNERPRERAEFRLVVRAGSVLEDEDQRGLAHIVEHMAFNGSHRFGARELVEYFESVGMRFGAHLNAHTSFDETVYKLQIPTDEPEVLRKAFWILRDWASSLLFLPEEIERERKVGLEEWRQGRGAVARVRDQLLPYIFFGTRYVDRLPIGTEQSLRTFSHDALIRFYRDWYRPDLMAVVAVGDFDSVEIEDEIIRHFSDLESMEQSRTREPVRIPLHEESFYSVVSDPEIPRASITLMSKTQESSARTHGQYLRTIAHEIALRGINERLEQMAQQPHAPFLGAHAGSQQLNETAIADVLSAAIPGEDYESCVRALVAELRRARLHGLTRSELERAKRRYLASMDAAYEERDTMPSKSLAQELVRSFTMGEAVPGIAYERELAHAFVPGLGLDEVNGLLSSWMDGCGLVVHIVCGEGSSPASGELRAWTESAMSSDVLPPSDEHCGEPLLPSPPIAGRVGSSSKREALGLSEWRMDNGAVVWIKPTSFQTDRIHFFAGADGGLTLAGDDDFVPAATSVGIAYRSGVGQHGLPQLQQLLAGRNMRLRPLVHPLNHGYQGLSSKSDLETLLQLFHLQSQEPRFSEDAFEREKEQREERLRNRLVDPGMLYYEEFQRRWWCDHLRHRPWDTAMLDRMSLGRSASFFRHSMSPAGGFHFILVGNIDLQAVRPLLETYVGGLPPAPSLSVVPRGERRISGVHRARIHAGTEPVARFRMRTLSRESSTMEDRVAVITLCELLRLALRRRLRDERGDIYAVQVGCRDSLQPVPSIQFSFEFGCDPAKAEELSDQVLGIIGGFSSSPPKPEDLAVVQQQLLRSNEEQLRDNEIWMSQLINAVRRGEDPGGVLLFPDIVRSLTPGDVLAAAGKYLDLQNRLELFLLPEKG